MLARRAARAGNVPRWRVGLTSAGRGRSHRVACPQNEHHCPQPGHARAARHTPFAATVRYPLAIATFTTRLFRGAIGTAVALTRSGVAPPHAYGQDRAATLSLLGGVVGLLSPGRRTHKP